MAALSDFEKDALRETANIGAGSASISLSEVLGKKVSILLSEIDLITDSNMLNQVVNEYIVGILHPIKSDFQGTMIVLFNKDSALSLANLLLKEGIGELNQEALNKLKEIGGIISTSYLKSFNEFFGTTLSTGTQVDIFDVKDNPTMLLIEDKAILFETKFNIDETEITGEFCLLLSSYDKLLDLIKEKMMG